MTTKTKTIVLGVTGSIAAYKTAELVRRMQQQGWDVWVMMTEAAAKYVGPLTFQALTKHPVAVGRCEAVESSTYQHLDLSSRAGVVVIAPCTANVLAKIAHGLADEVRGDGVARETVLLEQRPFLLAVIGLGDRAVHFKVVAPAGEFHAIVAHGFDFGREFGKRKVGPLAGEYCDGS